MDFREMFDERDINEALSMDPEVVAAKLELANEACDYWKSIYPVDKDTRAAPPRPPGTGRASIHVVHNKDWVSILNDDPIAHILEYGGEHMHEYATRAKTENHFNRRNAAK